MKYIASTGDGGYIANMFWFSETTPIITLKTKVKENACLFDNNEIESAIVHRYPNVKFIPVYFSTDLK